MKNSYNFDFVMGCADNSIMCKVIAQPEESRCNFRKIYGDFALKSAVCPDIFGWKNNIYIRGDDSSCDMHVSVARCEHNTLYDLTNRLRVLHQAQRDMVKTYV
jgi:hypothetical protein